MEQKIISYNDAKLKDLDEKIGQIDQEIDQLKGGAKLPVKIMDDENKIKQIILHQTKIFFGGTGPVTYMYFKFPFVPKIEEIKAPSVEINLKFVNNNNNCVISLFKVIVYLTSTSTICNIDNTHNFAKLIITEKLIVYYTDDEGKNHYFLKLLFNTHDTTINVSYLDVSTDSYIQEDFSTNDMILTELPKPATQLSNNINIVNPFVNALNNGSNKTGIITYSTTTPPDAFPYIYGNTTGTWSSTTLATGVYAWSYTGS
jgi:hypothetical protein